MMYMLLLAGFVLLIAGANYFVEGSAKLAALLRVSPLLIGLTIVAFGTSSPEATVSVIAALNGSAGVSLGNVIGSTVFNISLVIGITAMIMVIQVESETVKKEIPFTLLSVVALLVLIADVPLQQAEAGWITRGDGLILLLFFCIFIYYIVEAARNSRDQGADRGGQWNGGSWGKHILFSAGGLGAIVYGGHLVVQNSIRIALAWGMSETLVGLTIVAIGTSLPELVTSGIAAVKKQNELAVGNIVGSNIFNILFVLGLSSLITPLPVEPRIVVDVWLVLVLTVLLLIVSRTQYRIKRLEGFVLILAYAGYMVYIIARG